MGKSPAAPGPQVEVTGHTDTVGSEDDNDRLSMSAPRRCSLACVAGLRPVDDEAVGRGERELKEPTIDNVGTPANRRVEVIVR